MRRRRLGGRLLVGAALLGACSAACSVLVDTSDLAGSPEIADATFAADAAREASEAGAPDGSVDASSDAIVPPASPCRAPHLFCDDFDVGAIGATWDRKSGNTSLDPSTFSTPPFGFRAHVDKSFGNRSSRLEKSLTALPLACSFDLFVVGRGDSGGQSDLFSVLLDSAQTSTYVLLFGITPSSTYVGEYIEDADGGATPTVSVPNLTDRRWTHVTVELAPPVAKLTVDGTLVKTLPLAHPSVSVTAVHAGIAQARGGGAVDVVLDNVVCD